MASPASDVRDRSIAPVEPLQQSFKAAEGAVASVAQPVPPGNSLRATTVVQVSSDSASTPNLSHLLQKSLPVAVAPLFERFDSLRVYREPVVEVSEAQFLSLDTLYAIVRAIRNIFEYYLMTWGDEARLVDNVIVSVNRQDFRLDIRGREGDSTHDWLRDIQRIKAHQEVITHFLGDKAPAFRAFLVMVEERLCKYGVAKESERPKFEADLAILRQVQACPSHVASNSLGQELVVARAILEGFQLLEATLDSLSLRRFREELVYYTALLIQHEPAETELTAVKGAAQMVDQLRYSLSMTAKELLTIIQAHKKRFDDNIFTVQPVLAYLIREASQEVYSSDVVEMALQETTLNPRQQKVALRIIQEILATGRCDFDMVEVDFRAESQALEQTEGGGAMIAAVFDKAFDTVQQFIGIERARALLPERMCRAILSMSQGNKTTPGGMKDALILKFAPAFEVDEMKAAIEQCRETIVSIISDAKYQELLASFTKY